MSADVPSAAGAAPALPGDAELAAAVERLRPELARLARELYDEPEIGFEEHASVARIAALTPQTSGPSPLISSMKWSIAWAWPLSGSAVKISVLSPAATASRQAARFLASQPLTPPSVPIPGWRSPIIG